MHSQLMFNECIAKTRPLSLLWLKSEERGDSVHIINQLRQCILDCCRFSLCVYALRVGNQSNRWRFSTYFPAADSEEESQNIGLLLLLKLFDVLEGTHFDCIAN